MNAACGPYIAASVTSATTVASTITARFSVSSKGKKANAYTAAAGRTDRVHRPPADPVGQRAECRDQGELERRADQDRRQADATRHVQGAGDVGQHVQGEGVERDVGTDPGGHRDQ